MKDRLIKKTALYSVGFFTVSMCAILYLSMNKSIVISDVAQDEVAVMREGSAASDATGSADEHLDTDSQPKDGANDTQEIHSLKFKDVNMGSEYLAIPLPEDINPENITIENHYMDTMLCISLPGVAPEFFDTNELTGNHNEIIGGDYELLKNWDNPTDSKKSKEINTGTRINLEMKGIYEYKTVYENGQLYVSFLKPHEAFEKIVVIDPAFGGSLPGVEAEDICEKDVALSVAKKLKDILDATDIKAYYTRMDDVGPKEEARIRLANETKADAYIRIGVSFDEDQYVYGVTTKYNDEYFIPGFGNVDLADALEYEVVSAIKGKALGLVESTADDYTLKESVVPSASISVGYISNRQEVQLLTRDEYVEKIANGIYNAILRMYE